MIIQVGKGNNYTAVFDATAKTIVLTGLVGVDITYGGIERVFNVTRNEEITGGIVTKSLVKGLFAYTITFSTVPAASASTDELVILLNVPNEKALHEAQKDARLLNRNVTVLASAARTATVNSLDLTNSSGKGGHFIIDVTAGASATDTVIPKIQGKDPVSGKYYDILTGAAITAASTVVLKVYPSLTAVANLSVNDILPINYRVVVTHATAVAVTYSVSANLTV